LITWEDRIRIVKHHNLVNGTDLNKSNLANKSSLTRWLIGLVLAVAGACLVFNGEILGTNTIGIAMTINIVGIGLIATSGIRLLDLKRK
jgi:hypothetical protein